MHQKASAIYYSLSILLLLTAFFIMRPSRVPEVTALQGQIKQEFSVAWQQTIGDQPYFDDFGLIYDGVDSFYNQAAIYTISLIRQPESDAALAYIFKTTYQDFAQALKGGQPIAQTEIPPLPPGKFMSEAPIYNIVPEADNVSSTAPHGSGQVAGTSIQSGNPVNSTNQPWVTIQDNFTGQLYCLAIYNGDVNKYLGPCKYDYH